MELSVSNAIASFFYLLVKKSIAYSAAFAPPEKVSGTFDPAGDTLA
jgi:hypothetical protein